MNNSSCYEYDLTGLDDSVFLRRVRRLSHDSSVVEYKVFAAPGVADPYTYVVEVTKILFQITLGWLILAFIHFILCF